MSKNTEDNASKHPMILNDKCIQTNKRNQYLAGLAVSLGGFCAGTVLAWTSPALEYLLEDETDRNTTTNNNHTSPALEYLLEDETDRNTTTNNNHTTTIPTAPGFKISTVEQSFVAATLMLGALLFAIPSGKCADMFGRKYTLTLISLLYFVNYIVIACARTVMALVVARFLAGLALGGCCVVSPMYIGEIAEKSLRGILGSLFNVLLSLGILYTNVIGIFSNWVGLSVGLSVAGLAAAISLLFFPDTPVYLISAERFGKAKRALMFFRGDEDVVTEELTQLQKKSHEYEEGGTFIDLLTNKRYRKPLVAGLGVFIYQQFCGINVVVLYLVPIFRAAGSSINPLQAASTTSFISLLVGIVAVFVIEKRNRKYFLILSAVSMLIGITGLGLFFHLKMYGVHFPGLQVLPISSVVVFMAGFSIGLGPVPWILLIELYNPEIRGIASGVIIVSNWLSAFVVSFTYPYLMQSIGNTWTFYLYTLFNVLGILFIWSVVPETRKKAK